MTKTAFVLFTAAVLAGCARAPAPAPAVAVDSAPVVAEVPVVTGVAGLEAREPDACHAADYRRHIGQPGSIVPTLGISRPWRVAEYRGIEPEEYDALRVAFQLDAAGNIQSVTCG